MGFVSWVVANSGALLEAEAGHRAKEAGNLEEAEMMEMKVVLENRSLICCWGEDDQRKFDDENMLAGIDENSIQVKFSLAPMQKPLKRQTKMRKSKLMMLLAMPWRVNTSIIGTFNSAPVKCAVGGKIVRKCAERSAQKPC